MYIIDRIEWHLIRKFYALVLLFVGIHDYIRAALDQFADQVITSIDDVIDLDQRIKALNTQSVMS